MMDDLHIENDLPVSATDGWRQMESLLNTNLPVKIKVTAVIRLLSFLPAIFMSGIFLFSSLQLNNHLLRLPYFAERAQYANVAVNSDSALLHTTLEHQQDLDKILRTVRSAITNPSYENSRVSASEKLNGTHMLHVLNVDPARMNLPVKAIVIPVHHFNTALLPVKDKEIENSWAFSAGLAMNIAAGKEQSFQPYPVLEVKRKLGRRFFMAGGLSLLSPVAGNVSGISKTVYVNDTVNNISLYNEVKKYDLLRYADMAFTAGTNIHKNITLQAGIQLSVLIDSRKTKLLQPYDLQMNNVLLPSAPPIQTGLGVNPQQEFEIPMRKVDYRFVAGLKYQFKKLSAGIFYQQSLHPAGTGNSSTTVPNDLLTFNLSWKIK